MPLGQIGMAIAIATGEVEQAMVGEPVPRFCLETLDGKTAPLRDLMGKIVADHFAAGG